MQGDNQASTISVIMPACNVELYLPDCLDSVLAQTFSDFEIICVDDVSTDSTLEIMRRYAGLDRRVRVVARVRNGRIGSARNSGAARVRGEFVYFIDSDDYIHPQAFELLLGAMRAHDVDLVCGVDRTTQLRYEESKRDFSVFDTPSVEVRSDLFEAYFAERKIRSVAWNKLIRAELLQGLYSPRLRLAQDEIFTLNLLKRCRTVALVAEQTYYWFQRSESATNRPINSADIDAYFLSIRLIYDLFKTDSALVRHIRRRRMLEVIRNMTREVSVHGLIEQLALRRLIARSVRSLLHDGVLCLSDLDMKSNYKIVRTLLCLK